MADRCRQVWLYSTLTRFENAGHIVLLTLFAWRNTRLVFSTVVFLHKSYQVWYNYLKSAKDSRWRLCCTVMNWLFACRRHRTLDRSNVYILFFRWVGRPLVPLTIFAVDVQSVTVFLGGVGINMLMSYSTLRYLFHRYTKVLVWATKKLVFLVVKFKY